MDLNKPTVLKQLLEVHDLTVETREEWCAPNGRLPAVRTVWTEAEDGGAGRLDVEIVLDDERRVIERFAGLGATPDERQKDALRSLLASAFPAMVAAYWGQVDTDQITVERWDIGGINWQVFIGGFSKRAGQGVDVVVPKLYLEQIATAIRGGELTSDSHWIRTFFCNMNTDNQIYEALLDNTQWIEGERALKGLAWPKAEGFYSVRNFVVFKR